MKQTPDNNELAVYGRFGAAALLPGMRRIREVIDEEISRLEFLIREAEEAHAAEAAAEAEAKTEIVKTTKPVRKTETAKEEATIPKSQVLSELGMSKSGLTRAVSRLHIQPVVTGTSSREATYRSSDVERIRKFQQKKGASGPGSYWHRRTPEQRKAEMARRMAMRGQAA